MRVRYMTHVLRHKQSQRSPALTKHRRHALQMSAKSTLINAVTNLYCLLIKPGKQRFRSRVLKREELKTHARIAVVTASENWPEAFAFATDVHFYVMSIIGYFIPQDVANKAQISLESKDHEVRRWTARWTRYPGRVLDSIRDVLKVQDRRLRIQEAMLLNESCGPNTVWACKLGALARFSVR
ncbi:hypothetical protein BaRGS_00033968 [Batillaria attramentaria]|uniref:Uncharacterized protein n=1 Tax=Batillaria attramentaria TaxID=370345 RepID=A0ABD0JIF0_9CAEN